MKKTIFAVLDAASNCFGNPWVVPHVGIAIRSFTDEVNNPQEGNNLHYHSSDFALYRIGEYDDTSGVIDAHDRPELIAQASSVKTPSQSVN